jgi:hypothetical protein
VTGTEILGATSRKYQNRTIEAAQVIAQLIDLAKQMREGREMNVPQGQPKIVRRFNAGCASLNRRKSRRDDRNSFANDRMVCRPVGTRDRAQASRH